MEGPKSWQKEEITNWGRPQGEHEQIKRLYIYIYNYTFLGWQKISTKGPHWTLHFLEKHTYRLLGQNLQAFAKFKSFDP